MSSESMILELNQNNADRVVNNGEYHVTLARPIVVNSGDQIGLKIVSIDTQKVGASTIVVPPNTNLSITFSYYDLDYSITDKRNFSGTGAWRPGLDPTFDYFAGYLNNTEYYTFVSASLKIKGFVEPFFRPPPFSRNTSGSMLVSKSVAKTPSQAFIVNISYVNQAGNTVTAQLTGGNSQANTPSSGYWEASGPTVNLSSLNGAFVFKKGTLKVTSYAGAYPGDSFPTGATPPNGRARSPNDMPVEPSDFAFNTNISQEGGDVVANPTAGGGVNLAVHTETISVPSGTYDPRSFAIMLTQMLNDSRGIIPVEAGKNQKYIPNNKFLTRTDLVDNEDMIFRRVDFTSGTTVNFTNDNAYSYHDGTNSIPYFVGASQFALEYGSAGEAFSVNYAHMPLFDPDTGSGQKQMVGIYWTGTLGGNDLRYHQINQSSGIVIHDLQPEDFWRDKMGLYEQLVVPLQTDPAGVNYYLPDDMVDKITYGYASLDQFLLTGDAPAGTNPPHTKGEPIRKMIPIPPANPGAGKPDIVYIDVTGNTQAIIGSTATVNTDGGYYLVECVGLGIRRGGYVDNRSNNPSISAIVSTQYNSNNIVTGFADSGIPYTHIGQPYTITDATVRILDPKTKLPVTDLGANNSIIFEITKQDAIELAKKMAGQTKK